MKYSEIINLIAWIILAIAVLFTLVDPTINVIYYACGLSGGLFISNFIKNVFYGDK